MSDGPIAKFVLQHPWWSIGIIFVGLGIAISFVPTNSSQPAPKSTSPASPPTVAEMYPSLLQKQVDRLSQMHTEFDELKANRDKALDAGQSFTCKFSNDDLLLEADTVDASKVINAYRIRHADEIKALLHSNPKLKQLEVSERKLDMEVAVQEDELKSICY